MLDRSLSTCRLQSQAIRSSRYLSLLHLELRSTDRTLQSSGSAARQRHVDKAAFRSNSIFRFAPLPEQRRIVAKIDSLSAKSKRARDQLDHIPRLVEKYKQAILAAAFRGELTREVQAA